MSVHHLLMLPLWSQTSCTRRPSSPYTPFELRRYMSRSLGLFANRHYQSRRWLCLPSPSSYPERFHLEFQRRCRPTRCFPQGLRCRTPHRCDRHGHCSARPPSQREYVGTDCSWRWYGGKSRCGSRMVHFLQAWVPERMRRPAHPKQRARRRELCPRCALANDYAV